MTCCIAAACQNDTVIVSVSDNRLSWGYVSSDSVLKLVRLQYPYWLTMLSGEDISIGVETVTRSATLTLSLIKRRRPTALEVRNALLSAWEATRNQVGRAAVLSVYNVDVSTFRRRGRHEFGEQRFLELATELRDASRLKCELLVFGFDERKIPTLFVCDDVHGCCDVSRFGYVSVGTGHPTAHAMLALQNYRPGLPLHRAIYQVCAAKFAAESADGVGPTTTVVCLRNDGRTCFIEGEPIRILRQIWEREGRPRPPDDHDLVATVQHSMEWERL